MQRRTIKDISVDGFLRKKPSNRVVYSTSVTWSDKSANVVYRRYSEVKELELSLLEEFPSYKKEIISSSLQERRKINPTSVRKKEQKIKNFISKLMALPDEISQSQPVIRLFTPRIEDLEWQESDRTKDQKKAKSKSRRYFVRKISTTRKSLKAGNIGEPALLEQYMALKNYKKQYHNDIKLTNGFTVDVIEKHESGWWLVDCDGDIGWVPASFMQPTPGGTNNNDDDIITESFPPGRGELHMTTQSYEAKNEDELSFDIGVHLEVIEKTLDGWWRAIYMDKEGLAPALYLKRLGSAAGAAQVGLRRKSGMSIWLRENTGDFDETHSTNGVMAGTSNLLVPVWNGSRRHSSSEVELFSSAEKFRETRASNRRSMSYNDIRDALPNRGLYISEQDLRVADLQEKGSCKKQSRSLSFTSVGLKEFASKKKAEGQLPKSLTSLNFRKSCTQSERGFLKAEVKDEKHRPRSPSFSFFSRNIKDLSGTGKLAESVAAGISDTVDATNNIASFLELPTRPLVSSPVVRRRSSALSPVQKLQNESYEEPSMKFPLPKICVTPSQSDTEDVLVTSCMQGDEECQTLVDFVSENSVSQVDSGDEKRNDTLDEEFRNKRLLELKACENMKKRNKHHSTEKQEQVSKPSDIPEVKAEEPLEDFCEIRDLKKGIHGMELNNRKEDIDVVGQRRSTADSERDEETPAQAEMFLLNEARNSASKGSLQANHITHYAVSPYEAREPWEITLYKGDEVKVEKKARSGWWLVRANEAVGWAPSNFLADVTSTYQNEDSPVNDESGVNQGRKQPDCDGSEYESSDGSEDDNVDRGVDYDAAVCADDDDDDDDDDGGGEYDDGGKYEDDDDDEYDSYYDYNSNDSDRCDDDDDDDDDDDNDDKVFDSRRAHIRRLAAWKQRQFSAVQKRGSLVDSSKETGAPKWAPSNHYWLEPTSYRGRTVIRSSSETESSSNNSSRPRGRDSRQYRAFLDNNLRYRKRGVSQERRRFDTLRPNREEVFMLPEAKGYSASKEKGGKKRSPLIKQQRVASYDSGYPAEDERRKGLKTIKQSVSQSSAMVSNNMRHPALCRKCRTLTTDGYAVGNWFTPDLNAFESSDDEVFDDISRSDTWCGDFDVPPYNLRERRETRTRTNCHQNRYKPKATPNNSGHLTRGRRNRSAYQAMAMYQAMSENEIDLYEGDKVKVIRKSRSGWWYVNIDHEEGWAPSNFLKPIPWCGRK